jgi:hypothetical protein
MTEDRFRKLALELPGAIEGSHMGHPDFRVQGKIFATLLPDKGVGVLMLSPHEQRALVETCPDMFSPVSGGWGLKGATEVELRPARVKPVRDGLQMAWQARSKAS